MENKDNCIQSNELEYGSGQVYSASTDEYNIVKVKRLVACLEDLIDEVTESYPDPKNRKQTREALKEAILDLL